MSASLMCRNKDRRFSSIYFLCVVQIRVISWSLHRLKVTKCFLSKEGIRTFCAFFSASRYAELTFYGACKSLEA